MRAVPPASVEIVRGIGPAPDDHFTASPDRGVTVPRGGRVGRVSGRPTIRAGVVSAAAVDRPRVTIPTPDKHFSAVPNCPVNGSGNGRVGRARSCPTVGTGIISTTGVKRRRAIVSVTTPDDHFITRPDCGVILPPTGRISGAGSCPTVRNGIVPSPGVDVVARHNIPSAPDDHLSTGPHCRVEDAPIGRTRGTRGRPTIRAGIVLSSGVQGKAHEVNAAPDDHLTASPHCRVAASASGRVGGAGSRPSICGGIVSPASIVRVSAPHDHFNACPDPRV